MKYEVKLMETNTYRLVVEADSPEEAEKKAFEEEDYVQSLPDDTDTHVESVEELEE